MQMNANGAIVEQEWQRTAELRPYVGLDAFVVMPNHVHGIIAIDEPDSLACKQGNLLAAKSLGAIIGQFKGSVTKRIRSQESFKNLKVWQRNYHDHVVRNEQSLQNIREYVALNPANWADDIYFKALQCEW